MGRRALTWVWVMWMLGVNAAFAQGGDSPSGMNSAIERAILLGKSGQLDEGLSMLNPYLANPMPSTAKACYVAGFLMKERFKSSQEEEDRSGAVHWLDLALTLDEELGGMATWRPSAKQAMSFLGGSYFDDAVRSVRTFSPGDENNVVALFEAHVTVARRLDPSVDATVERTELHKNLARAYRQWYESTGNEAHFQGVVNQYEAALSWSPNDVTATYNLAVNVYNRGVALIKSLDENTSLGEMFAIQDESTEFFRQALPWFEQANVLQPNRPETLKGLMIVHHALLDDEASEMYRARLEKALAP